MTLCYCHDMAETPRRTVRVSDELWEDFEQLAADNGNDTSTELRNAMRAHINRERGIQT